MCIKPVLALVAVMATAAGCAQLDALTSTTRRDEPAASASAQSSADELYVNTDAPVAYQTYRNVYISPANLANMQVIQPEGATADSEWWVTDSEDGILQRAIATQFAVALSEGSSFNIVYSPAEAQMIVNTAVVAIHPNETRSSRAAGGKPGGAVTVSIAVVDAATDRVLVRSVETRSSDDIWAFNQVENNDPAIDGIFRACGDSVRRGLLQLQGRTQTP
jgi:hypothetical protein